MKKLLATLLCVMLLLGAIPSSAFAGVWVRDPGDAAAVDLGPAYEARKTLYASYGMLATAVAAKNTAEGLGNTLGLFAEKLGQFMPAVMAFWNYEDNKIAETMSQMSSMNTQVAGIIGEDVVKELENFLEKYPNGLGVKTIFEIFAPYIEEYYGIVSNKFAVGSTELAIDSLTLDAYGALNGVLNEFDVAPVRPQMSEPVIFIGSN